MKFIFKLLLAVTFALTSANAMQKDEIKTTMASKIDNVLLILKKDALTTNQKADEIITIIDEVFDYPTMAKIALGKKTWKSLSKEKRAEFVSVFEEKLKNSYIDKLELYTDQKVKIVDLKPYKKTRLQLETELLGKDEVFKINYNFYNNKKAKKWLVYDVDLVGVSIIQTYRKQFSGLLKEKTFDEMLEVLKESNKK